MNNPLISIIIPVYNTEKYLKRCLDSVVAQTYTNWECLLIDDGSTDSSGAICDEYASKDSRFRVFHKENGGVSKARNFGLTNSKGDWVTFVDSDDELFGDALSNFYNDIITSNADIIRSGYIEKSEKQEIRYSCGESQLLTQKKEILKMCDKSIYYAYLWNSCVKRYIALSHKMYEDINLLEDMIYIDECLYDAKSVYFDSQPTYVYYVRNTAKGRGSGLSDHKIDPEVVLRAYFLERDMKIKLAEQDSALLDSIKHSLDGKIGLAAFFYMIRLQIGKAFCTIHKYSNSKVYSLKWTIRFLVKYILNKN